MTYGTPDVYYQPEHFGLTPIGEIDDPEACYSFDKLVVWQHDDGRLFWASDSGCSCPSPFEDYTSLDDLNDLTAETWNDFAEDVKEHALPWDKSKDDLAAADKTELLAKVSRLLRHNAKKPPPRAGEAASVSPSLKRRFSVPEGCDNLGSRRRRRRGDHVLDGAEPVVVEGLASLYALHSLAGLGDLLRHRRPSLRAVVDRSVDAVETVDDRVQLGVEDRVHIGAQPRGERVRDEDAPEVADGLGDPGDLRHGDQRDHDPGDLAELHEELHQPTSRSDAM